ncbi:MAG: c-type cytochrome [Hormoscilla sp.]
MRKLVAIILLAVAVFTFGLSSPAFAVATLSGDKVFKQNCAACHAGGKNTVKKNKSLSQADLEVNGRYSKDAIIKQVTNGGGGMASFKRLGKQNIENVANYVLEQAKAGWPKK